LGVANVISLYVSCKKSRKTKFMKANYSKLLLSLASMLGLAGGSLLITLPSKAIEAINPNPTVFQNASTATKENIKPQKQLAQGGGAVNPRPSIFNEPPYNRGGRTTPGQTVPIPSNTPKPKPTRRPKPTTPPTEVPTTETPSKTPPDAGTTNTQDKNLVQIAESNGSFKMLTAALKAAGLIETLQGKENFTVFAPTDAAFAKLPPAALRDLLKPENKEILVKILTYHVVSGKVLSTDLKSGEVKSIEGGAINVKIDPAKGVTVNDAKVTQADIQGSNGVIHVIDQVMLPPDL
jgi:uncharacterized surface protein with fasciclin (FAS1) repeats